MTIPPEPRPQMESWRYAMRAAFIAICIGSAIVTLATLGVRIRQTGFLGGGGSEAVFAPPPPAAPLSPEDSARRAHPFSQFIPNDPPPAGVDTRSPLANGLLLGALGGVFATWLISWTLLAPIPIYRRGALTLASGMGTLIGMMVAVPFDLVLLQPGLILYAVLLLIGAWRLKRSITDVEIVEPLPYVPEPEEPAAG